MTIGAGDNIRDLSDHPTRWIDAAQLDPARAEFVEAVNGWDLEERTSRLHTSDGSRPAAPRRFPTVARNRIAGYVLARLEGAYQRIRGVGFRPYIHSPRAIVETAQTAGFEIAFEDRDIAWHGVVFQRAA